MTEELHESGVAHDLRVLAEIKELCGPPPVLSSESVKAYFTMMLRLIESIMPRDFVEQLFVKHLTDWNWEIFRYTRHKTLLVERRYLLRRAYQAQRHNAQAKYKEEYRTSPTDPEDLLDGLVGDVDAILLKPAAELDHARALEVTLAYLERLDKLLNAATGRRNDVLEQLERYRDGLGEHALQAAKRRIESYSSHKHEGFCSNETAAYLEKIMPELFEPPTLPLDT